MTEWLNWSIVYMCQSQSPSASRPPVSPLVCICLFSTSLSQFHIYSLIYDIMKEESKKSWLEAKYWKTQDHGIQSHCCMANIRGKGGRCDRFPLLVFQNHCGWWLQPWNQKMITSWHKSDDKPRKCTEKQRHYSANKFHIVKAMVFPVVPYGCETGP